MRDDALVPLAATFLAAAPQRPLRSHGKQIQHTADSPFACEYKADGGDSAPMQTCATSLIAPGASAEVFTFACFDTRTRIAEIVAPGVARVTPMPMLDPVPVLEYPNPAPESTSNTESTWLETDTLTVIGFGDYPYGSTTVETLIWTSTKDAPFATDMPLSLSSETTLTVIPILQGTTTPASMTSIQTNAQASIQAIPTVVSSKSTPGSPGPSHTSIVIGGLFGSLAFVGIFITSVDYLIKRRRYNRCRDSISDTSTGDDTSAPSKEEQHQQMTAYGYYGTNRAGIVTKGSGVFKANAEPVELPAENATEHRE